MMQPHFTPLQCNEAFVTGAINLVEAIHTTTTPLHTESTPNTNMCPPFAMFIRIDTIPTPTPEYTYNNKKTC